VVILYHAKYARSGKTFTEEEAKRHCGRNGWVDSPAKLNQKSFVQTLLNLFRG